MPADEIVPVLTSVPPFKASPTLAPEMVPLLPLVEQVQENISDKAVPPVDRIVPLLVKPLPT